MIFPGDFLGVSEEFSAGSGVYEEESNLFSSLLGEKTERPQQRQVSVKPFKNIRRLQINDLVYGRVENVYKQIALISFQPVEKNVAATNSFAYLRISEVGYGYVERFRDNLQIGDLLRARIKEATPLGIYLTIVDSDLGVIKAFCSNCKTLLKQPTPVSKTLQCPRCGSREDRKLVGAAGAPQGRQRGGQGRDRGSGRRRPERRYARHGAEQRRGMRMDRRSFSPSRRRFDSGGRGSPRSSGRRVFRKFGERGR